MAKLLTVILLALLTCAAAECAMRVTAEVVQAMARAGGGL